MTSHIKKVIINTRDKAPHESYSDCLINLHKPIDKAYAFKLRSAHTPVDAPTFSLFDDELEYAIDQVVTFPNFGRLNFIRTRKDTGAYLQNQFLDIGAQNVWTDTQLTTSLGNDFASAGITGWSASYTTRKIQVDITPNAGYDQEVKLIGYNLAGAETNHDYMNLNGTTFNVPKSVPTFDSTNNKLEYKLGSAWVLPEWDRIEVTFTDLNDATVTHTRILAYTDIAPFYFSQTQFVNSFNNLMNQPNSQGFTMNATTTPQTGSYATDLSLQITVLSQHNRYFTFTPYSIITGKPYYTSGQLQWTAESQVVLAGSYTTFRVAEGTNFSPKFSFEKSKTRTITFDTITQYGIAGVKTVINNHFSGLAASLNVNLTAGSTGNTLTIQNNQTNINRSFKNLLYVEFGIDYEPAAGHQKKPSYYKRAFFTNVGDVAFDYVTSALDGTTNVFPDNLNNLAYISYLFNRHLAGGDTSGVFQVSGLGIRYVLQDDPTTAWRDVKIQFYGHDGNLLQDGGVSGFFNNINYDNRVFTSVTSFPLNINVSTSVSFPTLPGFSVVPFTNEDATATYNIRIYPSEKLGLTKKRDKYVNVHQSTTYTAESPVDFLSTGNATHTLVFTNGMDPQTLASYPTTPSVIKFNNSTIYNETNLASFLNAQITNVVFSFVDHKLRVVNNTANKVRLYRNDKLGIQFANDNIQFTELAASGGSFQSTYVGDLSTHIMNYLGLSIYGDGVCSTDNSVDKAHTNNIVAVLHNNTGSNYGGYMMLDEPSDMMPINAHQFSNIRVQIYDENYRTCVHQTMPSHLEIDIYCKD